MCREGFKIRPYTRGIQLLVFHLRCQVFTAEGFDLHKRDDSMFKSGKVKSSLDTPVSATKADDSG